MDDISNAPWSLVDIFDDTDDKLDIFNSLFHQILDQHAPVKTVKLRARPNPFIDDNIRSLMRSRDHWQRLARQTNDPAMWSGYRNFRREVKREIRIAQREFVEQQIRQNPNNTRSIWKTIRSCIPKQPVNVKSFTKDDQTVANEFNKFFSSVGKSTTEKIQLLASKFNYTPALDIFIPRNYPASDQFFFTKVECSQVKDIVNSIPNNKAPGIDKVPPRVIKESSPAIVPCITSIINASFESGVFPASWKIAEVFPILKNGDHEEPNNYRPISLLPILSKICERVALNQLTSYLTSNQRISAKQSGNKRWHSTETALISSTDFVLRAIDQKKITAVVYLDMSKAFDTINHAILLKKLKNIGLSSSALQWFESYLSQRNQAVRINSVLSDRLPVVSGVPQGSVLGALLFSIYVNDLPNICQDCSTECYVDDTKLLLSFNANDPTQAIEKLNSDLQRIRNWCFDNCLMLNPEKTKLMVFGSRRMALKVPDFKLSLLGKEIIPVQTVKDLGVIFDPTLSFDNHISATVSSCMSKLSQLSRIRFVFNKELLENIINALVFSKLYYCSSVWSSTSACNVHKLQYVQNFAARIIHNVRKYDHISSTLRNLRWLPVKTILYYRDAILTFKCMAGRAPEYLTSEFVTRGSASRRLTRNFQQRNIPLFKTTTGQRTFYYRSVSIWNKLDSRLKQCEKPASFKRALKKQLLSEFLFK